MKPYRGTLLAAAMLLAALQISGCGDADEWQKTSQIKLEVKQGTGLNDVIFTVTSVPPEASDSLNACETLLEYRAEGAGVNIPWSWIPGIETTRVFSVRPLREGEMTVIARGKCADSIEDWKYSNRVEVTVTKVAEETPTPTTPPTPTSVTLTAITPSPYDRESGLAPDISFTLAAVKPAGCTLVLSRQHSGAGYLLVVQNPTSAGTHFIGTPSATGTLTIAASGWCTQNPSAIVSATPILITVIDPP